MAGGVVLIAILIIVVLLFIFRGKKGVNKQAEEPPQSDSNMVEMQPVSSSYIEPPITSNNGCLYFCFDLQLTIHIELLATSFDEDVSMQVSDTIPFINPKSINSEGGANHSETALTLGHGKSIRVNDINEEEYYA